MKLKSFLRGVRSLTIRPQQNPVTNELDFKIEDDDLVVQDGWGRSARKPTNEIDRHFTKPQDLHDYGMTLITKKHWSKDKEVDDGLPI